MKNLFEVNLDIKENDSTKFIGRLKKSGFQRDNYSYISSYPGGVGTAYNLIKKIYDKEVVGNGDSMIIFLKKINSIIEQEKILSYKNYTDTSTDETTTAKWMMRYYESYMK